MTAPLDFSALQMAVLKVYRRTRVTPGPLDTPCLVWQGAVNSAGYGVTWLSTGPRSTRAVTVQRLVYCFATQRPIPAGLVIGHRCDRKTCCEFTHLEAITPSQNTRDAWARGLRQRMRSLT